MTFLDEDRSCLKSGCFVVLPVLQFELDIEGAIVEETGPLNLQYPPGQETSKLLINNQLEEQSFCMFISILYMFRAAMCPSSGELLYQCDTWFVSLCVDD